LHKKTVVQFHFRAFYMLIGVVSDTHGHVEYTREAVRVLKSCQVEAVIHCGDIGTPAIVRLFDGWPTHFVFGNCDDDKAGLRAAMQTAGQTCHERFGSLELLGKRIAFLHGDDSRLLAETASAGSWHLVCYGHTHQASEERQGGTIVLNPGALYRATPHSIALVQLPELVVTTVTV